MNLERHLLLAGSGVPILYFAALFVAGALYPEFSHIKQQASDLGASDAPYTFAPIFNAALVGVAILGLAGAVGLTLGLPRLSASRSLAVATGLALAMPSLSIGQSGIFPLPSPHHTNLLFLLAGMLAPLLGAVALRQAETPAVRVALLLSFVLGMSIVVCFFGVGGVVTEENVGLWLRIWAAVTLPAIGLLCYTVRIKLP